MAISDYPGQFLRTRALSRVIVIFLLITVGSWMGWRLRILHAQEEPPVEPPPTIVTATWRGFLRSDTFGWISLSCENDWNADGVLALPAENDCAGPGGEYGLTVAFNLSNGEGSLSGYGWSPYLGLVCFGATCAGPDPDGASPSQAIFNLDIRTAVEDVTQPSGVAEIALLDGWARVEAHAQSGGWINLGGVEGVTVLPRPAAAGGFGIVGTGVNDLDFRGTAWQRNPDGSGVGWISFGPAPPGRALTGGGSSGGGGGGSTGGSTCTAPARVETTAELCLDQQDNDSDDGLNSCDTGEFGRLNGLDCQDYDCAGSPACPALEQDANCFDRLDNDLDAWQWNGQAYVQNLINNRSPIDCDDPDCAGVCVTNEFSAGERNFCLDSQDNDGDGALDCADAECKDSPLCANPEHVLCTHPSGLSGCEEKCPARETDAIDQDGICTPLDNCPGIANPDQRDSNGVRGGDACDAFLETKQGSIYARRLITTPPPTGAHTATYCILTSAGVEGQFLAPYRPTSAQCELPKDELVARFRLQQYTDSNSIALLQSLAQQTLRTRLDLKQLVKGVTPVKDAKTVVDILRNPSGGPVIHVSGALTLDEEINIPAGRGAVTVVVDGTLTFGSQAKISYATETGIALRKLASLAWIVLGDININPAVTDLAGAFFAAGKIDSGSGTSPLTVQGLMAARSFAFDREYVDPNPQSPRGAEQIIYDGRAALNPPPGLTDLVKTLPTFRTVAPR